MPDNFADALRSKRLALGLTQEALAERAGISTQAISSLERGTRRFPQRVTLDLLADALGLEPDERADFERLGLREGVQGRASGPNQPALRQLPLGTDSFVGRTTDVARLAELLANGSSVAGSPTVATVQGMAGVGKTALALKAAHLAADHYPDGSIYLDLRGFGAGVPLSVEEALGQLLRATGLAADAVPATAERASALLRSRLASQRVLLLFDNASGAEQVTPLLPAGSSCSVLVTSRQNLTTLAADSRVHLSPLTETEAIDVFRLIVGEERTSAEPKEIAELAELCGGLPLALNIAAARLSARPTWSARYLADRLRDETSRLDELTVDHLGVRAALTISVSQLTDRHPTDTPALADTFALLGTLSGSDIGAEVAARLLDTSPHAAEDALEQLVDVHLLESTTPGRYRFHDLVHVYAQELATDRLPPATRQAALARVIRLFGSVAWRGTQMLYPSATRLSWCAPEWLEPMPWITSVQDSYAWLDRERDNLAGILNGFTADRQPPDDLAPGLVLGLWTYFSMHGHLDGWHQALDRALDMTEDRRLKAALLHDRGVSSAESGEMQAAAEDLKRSDDAFRELGDLQSELLVSGNYSQVLHRLGRIDQAIPIVRRLERMRREAGDHRGAAQALFNLSNLYESIGDYPQCLIAATESLGLFETVANDIGIGIAAHNVGSALVMLGQLDLATPYLYRSLELTEKVGDLGGLTDVCRDLGETLVLNGNVEDGFQFLRRALTIADERNDEQRAAAVRRVLGQTYLAIGNEKQARVELLAALEFYQGRIPKAAEEILGLLDGLND